MICEIEGVSYAYPGAERDALRTIDLAVGAGEHVAIVGPNGAGKSTVVKLLTGIIRPDSGRVRVLGRSPESWKRRDMARNVGVVSQTPEVIDGITVRDLVRMGRHPYASPWAPLSSADEAVVDRCIGAVDLTVMAEREAGTLSGGELQRARLARALAQEPRLLLLDEPTAHLDLGHEARFMELITQYVSASHLTVIHITHNLSDAGRHADRLVLMSEGSILAEGAAGEVLSPPLLNRAFGWPVEVVDLGALGLRAVPALRSDREGSA